MVYFSICLFHLKFLSSTYQQFLICFVQLLSHVHSFETLWTVVIRLLCPQDSPGKNTGVGCHFILQGVFPIHIKPMSPALQADSLPMNHLESPITTNFILFDVTVNEIVSLIYLFDSSLLVWRYVTDFCIFILYSEFILYY